ncbi:MAG: long-chain-fatty-acid--CoA ligase [Acidobacteriota bacterium]
MNVPLSPLMFLRRATKLYPNKTGVVCGEHRFTYSQFSERVRRLSTFLQMAGIRKGDVVAFLSRNCHRLLEAYYGVIECGAVLLPLNIRLTPEDFQYALNHSGARLLFFEDDFLDSVDRFRSDLSTVKEFVLLDRAPISEPFPCLSYEDCLAAAEASLAQVPLEDENDVAELFYTSGTSDRPKGVMLTHRNLYLHALNVALFLQTQDVDVQLHTIPLFHANGWGATHSITCMGGTHVMLKRFDPRRVFQLIESEKITTFNLVPTMATSLLQENHALQADFSGLRLIHLGGSAVPWTLVEALEKRFGCAVTCGYGLSETSPVLTVAHPKSHLKDAGETRYRRLAMTGLELPGTEVRVVDEEGREVAPDARAVGEIIARGNTVMKGYWNDPVETAKALRKGWLYTGDMAVVDSEGYILIVDRKKDLIIRGGENISSVEVEKALYAHPAVLEAAVIAVPDPKWGEVPKAFVVLKPETECTSEELRRHCRKTLAAYKIPDSFELVASLPKGGTGKILKRLLRAPYWSQSEKQVH